MLRVFMRVPGVDRIDFRGVHNQRTPVDVVLIIRLVHMCPILENRSCVMCEMFGCPILQKRTHWGRTGWVV